MYVIKLHWDRYTANRKNTVKIGNFVGREKEIALLNDLTTIGGASLVVIKGRRRIGKSRLAEEFGQRTKGYKTISISAAPPHPKTETPYFGHSQSK